MKTLVVILISGLGLVGLQAAFGVDAQQLAGHVKKAAATFGGKINQDSASPVLEQAKVRNLQTELEGLDGEMLARREEVIRLAREKKRKGEELIAAQAAITSQAKLLKEFAGYLLNESPAVATQSKEVSPKPPAVVKNCAKAAVGVIAIRNAHGIVEYCVVQSDERGCLRTEAGQPVDVNHVVWHAGEYSRWAALASRWK